MNITTKDHISLKEKYKRHYFPSQKSFTEYQNTMIRSSRRQSSYYVESSVLKSSETMCLTITNHPSFEVELHVDCSKISQNTINVHTGASQESDVT